MGIQREMNAGHIFPTFSQRCYNTAALLDESRASAEVERTQPSQNLNEKLRKNCVRTLLGSSLDTKGWTVNNRSPRAVSKQAPRFESRLRPRDRALVPTRQVFPHASRLKRERWFLPETLCVHLKKWSNGLMLPDVSARYCCHILCASPTSGHLR